MRAFTDAERRRRLVRRHGLGGGARAFEWVAKTLAGVHSTDPASVYLAAHARGSASKPADVEQTLYEDRSVLRMLGMRRTLFVVPLDLMAAVQRGYTDRFVQRERTRLAGWLEETGVAGNGERHIDDLEKLVLDFLADTEAPTREITAAIPELQVRFTPPVGSATGTVSVGSRLVLLLTAGGKLARTRPLGTWISSQYRYTRIENWIGSAIPAMEPAKARATLAHAWLQGYGPGTLTDLQWWSGWNLGQTRAALAAVDAVEVALDHGTGYVLADDLDDDGDAATSVALLPALDSTPMGWKEREWYVGSHADDLFDRNGNIGPTVWWDGRIVGGWAQADDGDIRIGLLEEVPGHVRDGVDEAANDIARFVGETRFTPRFRTPLEHRLRS